MFTICVEVRNCALCITKSFSNLCLSADNSADMGQDVVSCPGLVGHTGSMTQGIQKKIMHPHPPYDTYKEADPFYRTALLGLISTYVLSFMQHIFD